MNKPHYLELAMFCRQMHLLMESGFTCDEALGICIELRPNDKFLLVMSRVQQDLRDGHGLAESLDISTVEEYLPKIFVRALLKAKETNKEKETFKALSDYIHYEASFTTAMARENES